MKPKFWTVIVGIAALVAIIGSASAWIIMPWKEEQTEKRVTALEATYSNILEHLINIEKNQARMDERQRVSTVQLDNLMARMNRPPPPPPYRRPPKDAMDSDGQPEAQ